MCIVSYIFSHFLCIVKTGVMDTDCLVWLYASGVSRYTVPPLSPTPPGKVPIG